MGEIIGPFAVAEQIGTRHLDLDDDDVAARIDRHQIGTAPVLQRHFRKRDAIVAKQQPRDAAGDVGGDQGPIEQRVFRNRNGREVIPGRLEH